MALSGRGDRPERCLLLEEFPGGLSAGADTAAFDKGLRRPRPAMGELGCSIGASRKRTECRD